MRQAVIFFLGSQREAIEFYYGRITPLSIPSVASPYRFNLFEKTGKSFASFSEFIPDYLGGVSANLDWALLRCPGSDPISLLLFTDRGFGSQTKKYLLRYHDDGSVSNLANADEYFPSVDAFNFYKVEELSDEAKAFLHTTPLYYHLFHVFSKSEIHLNVTLNGIPPENAKIKEELERHQKVYNLNYRWNGCRFEEDLSEGE